MEEVSTSCWRNDKIWGRWEELESCSDHNLSLGNTVSYNSIDKSCKGFPNVLKHEERLSYILYAYLWRKNILLYHTGLIIWIYLDNISKVRHGSSDSKESPCNVGDLGSNPGLGRAPGEGHDYPLVFFFFFEKHLTFNEFPNMWLQATWTQAPPTPLIFSALLLKNFAFTMTGCFGSFPFPRTL